MATAETEITDGSDRPTNGGRRRYVPRAEGRVVLIDATIELLRNNAFADVTTRKISEAADLNEFAIQRIFGSQLGLFAEVLDATLKLTASLISTAPVVFTPPLLFTPVPAVMLNCAVPPKFAASVVNEAKAVVPPTMPLKTSFPAVLTVNPKPPSTIELNVMLPSAPTPVLVSTVFCANCTALL